MKTLIGFIRQEGSGSSGSWPASLLALLQLGIVVLVAELLLLFLGHIEVGQVIVGGAMWVTQFIGPVWVALVPLALSTLWAALVLLCTRIGVLTVRTDLLLKILIFSENTGPVLGLLGTFLGLWGLMMGLDAKLPTTELVALLVRRGGEAFGSSVAGVIVQLAAYGARFFFINGEDQ